MRAPAPAARCDLHGDLRRCDRSQSAGRTGPYTASNVVTGVTANGEQDILRIRADDGLKTPVVVRRTGPASRAGRQTIALPQSEAGRRLGRGVSTKVSAAAAQTALRSSGTRTRPPSPSVPSPSEPSVGQSAIAVSGVESRHRRQTQTLRHRYSGRGRAPGRCRVTMARGDRRSGIRRSASRQ